MKKIYFYLPPRTINDATDYYCGLLEEGMKRAGYMVERVSSTDKIKRNDTVVIIRPRDILRLPKVNLITWFQGIGPEEFRMVNGNSLKSWLGSKILEIFDRRALQRSKIAVFVSESMRDFFEKKYKHKTSKAIIIPCYNKNIDAELFFNKERYENLNFVYAGGLSAWQCIDETLLIFKEIVSKEPSAKLTLLTSEEQKANELINKYALKNVAVDYVKLEHLQKRLSEFKYGFLIRDNNIVNNVATPTKMNSYMACGLLPIYSDVIDDFKTNIHLGEFAVKIQHREDLKTIAQAILDHHALTVNNKFLLDVFRENFENYYNDEKYIRLIVEKIKEI